MPSNVARVWLHHLFALVLALLLALVTAANATAADALPETPGWYRAQIGRFTVTALWDGTLDMPSIASLGRFPKSA